MQAIGAGNAREGVCLRGVGVGEDGEWLAVIGPGICLRHRILARRHGQPFLHGFLRFFRGVIPGQQDVDLGVIQLGLLPLLVDIGRSLAYGPGGIVHPLGSQSLVVLPGRQSRRGVHPQNGTDRNPILIPGGTVCGGFRQHLSAAGQGNHAGDYAYLPPLKGPDGTCTVTIKSAGSAVNSGSLSITKDCKSPANLLKFYDQWYTGENVMQLQYGPIGVYFNEEKDDQGMYVSITDEEAREKFNKSAGELKSTYEVAGPKLILSEYYLNVFHMEDRAMQRLNDLENFWFKYVDDFTYYPVDCVFTRGELDDLDLYRPDFESHVREQEALWLRDGGPTDEEWAAYKQDLVDTYGMDKLVEVYQNAYARYNAAE